jgi:hypothetical protein
MVRGRMKAGARNGRRVAPTRVAKRHQAGQTAGDLAMLKRLALTVGLDTARRALDDLERGLEALMAG